MIIVDTWYTKAFTHSHTRANQWVNILTQLQDEAVPLEYYIYEPSWGSSPFRWQSQLGITKQMKSPNTTGMYVSLGRSPKPTQHRHTHTPLPLSTNSTTVCSLLKFEEQHSSYNTIRASMMVSTLKLDCLFSARRSYKGREAQNCYSAQLCPDNTHIP